MPDSIALLKRVQKKHENGTLVKEFPNVDTFSFDNVFFTPRIEMDCDQGLDIFVIECVMVRIDSTDGIDLPQFTERETLDRVEPCLVFQYEDDCWQHVVDTLTKGLDDIESNLSIAKCRVRECKDAINNNN